MRRWWALGLAIVLCACGAKAPSAPGIGDCLDCEQGPSDSGFSRITVTPNDGGGDGSAAREAGGVVTKTITLALIADPDFAAATQNFPGAAIVTSFDADQTPVDTGKKGVTTSGQIAGVATGPNWFAVQDIDSTHSAIAPTLQPVNVDSKDTAIALSALDSGVLANTIVSDLPLGAPHAGAATVVLVFRQGAKNVSGIRVTGNSGDSAVGYFDGHNSYPASPKMDATGASSTVVVRDLPVAATFPKLQEVQLKYSVNNGAPIPISVRAAQAFVTWMVVDVE